MLGKQVEQKKRTAASRTTSFSQTGTAPWIFLAYLSCPYSTRQFARTQTVGLQLAHVSVFESPSQLQTTLRCATGLAVTII